MFSRLSLRAKILLLVSFQIAICLVISFNGIHFLKSVSNDYESVASVAFPKSMALSGMRGEIHNVIRLSIKLGVAGYSEKEQKVTLAKLEKAKKAFGEEKAKFDKFELNDKEKQLVGTLLETWSALLKTEEKLEPLQMSANANDRAAALDLQKGEFDKQYHDVFDAVGDVLKYEKDLSDTAVASARTSAGHGMQSSIAGTIIGGLIAMGIGLLFSISLAKTFARVSNELSTGADVVNQASDQLLSLSSQVAKENRTQAAALQETVAAIEEINAMINKNSENAKESREVAGESQAAVGRGQNAVELTVSSISRVAEGNRHLNEQVAANTKDLDKIVKVIEDIGSKTAVINEIVFQTKLLSFNASVEAARAGEQGKGFSVVAEEVGNLARLSGSAAKEISDLLESSVVLVKTTIRNTTEGFQKNLVGTQDAINEAVENANQCRQTLDEIVRQSTEVERRVEEIATATNEQSRGVQEITKAMSLLEKGTHQSTQISESSAKCASQLSEESKHLHRNVTTLLEVTRGSGDGSSNSDSGHHMPQVENIDDSHGPSKMAA